MDGCRVLVKARKSVTIFIGLSQTHKISSTYGHYKYDVRKEGEVKLKQLWLKLIHKYLWNEGTLWWSHRNTFVSQKAINQFVELADIGGKGNFWGRECVHRRSFWGLLPYLKHPYMHIGRLTRNVGTRPLTSKETKMLPGEGVDSSRKSTLASSK